MMADTLARTAMRRHAAGIGTVFVSLELSPAEIRSGLEARGFRGPATTRIQCKTPNLCGPPQTVEDNLRTGEP